MSAGLLDSARSAAAGLLELGRIRFELFGVELREELARLTAGVLGGLAVLMLAGLGLAFSALAVILYVGEAHRLAASVGAALVFFAFAGALAAWLKRAAGAKPRAFDATLTELQRDLTAIKP